MRFSRLAKRCTVLRSVWVALRSRSRSTLPARLSPSTSARRCRSLLRFRLFQRTSYSDEHSDTRITPTINAMMSLALSSLMQLTSGMDLAARHGTAHEEPLSEVLRCQRHQARLPTQCAAACSVETYARPST